MDQQPTTVLVCIVIEKEVVCVPTNILETNLCIVQYNLMNINMLHTHIHGCISLTQLNFLNTNNNLYFSIIHVTFSKF